MASDDYIFAESQQTRECSRLQTIEKIFDSATKSRLESMGINKSWQCLEVGAGAGSITRWLSTQVGSSGKVVAVDLNTRLITGELSLESFKNTFQNIDIIEADIRHLEQEEHRFDLIHARFVLIHIADVLTALTKMLKFLKPGGRILLEEPDFSLSRAIVGEKTACKSVNQVNQAIWQMFQNRGMDYAFGLKLPSLLQEFGLHLVSVDYEVHLDKGGSEMATMMMLSTQQLTDNYLATGKANQQDIQKYCDFAQDPETWAIYHATMRVIAEKSSGDH